MLIAQITDAHVGTVDRPLHDCIDTSQALSLAVATLNSLDPRPDIVLFTGDLVESGTPAEYARVAALMAPLEMPLALVPGNHDQREPLRRAFAKNLWLPAGNGPLHQVIDELPVRLIGLDTLDETQPGAGIVDGASLRWLNARLSEAPEKPTVIFMHHPPFKTGIAHMDAIACGGGEDMAAVVAQHHHVDRVLCGHVHRPVTACWAGTLASICPSVAHQVAFDLRSGGPPAFSAEPPALQLHLWVNGQGFVSHTHYLGDHGPSYSFATGQPL